MPIRLIDLGYVSYVRSQTIYHSIAYGMKKTAQDTIVLVNPDRAYACIGYHQDVGADIDLDFCQTNNLPIIRREIGGGAVYLDERQLFTQWVFHPGHLPWNIHKRFEIFIRPIVQTYKRLGIEAYLRPINDIHVAGKKICGTGAGAIGEAEVLVGNFLFDFDFELMSSVLKVPDEKYRDRIHESLRAYLTTIKQELGYLPDRQKVIEIYVQQCKEILGRELEYGELTTEELSLMDELDEKFQQAAWLHQEGRSQYPTVKIHSDVWLSEVSHKIEEREIRLQIRTHKKLIDSLAISGDVDFLPAEKLADFERGFMQQKLDCEVLTPYIKAFYDKHSIDSSGIEVKDWIEAIVKVKEQLQKASNSRD